MTTGHDDLRSLIKPPRPSVDTSDVLTITSSKIGIQALFLSFSVIFWLVPVLTGTMASLHGAGIVFYVFWYGFLSVWCGIVAMMKSFVSTFDRRAGRVTITASNLFTVVSQRAISVPDVSHIGTRTETGNRGVRTHYAALHLRSGEPIAIGTWTDEATYQAEVSWICAHMGFERRDV